MPGAPLLCNRANPTTPDPHVAAAHQNAHEGRFPVRSVEMTAVAMGRAPMTTAECEADVVCSARVVSKGKRRAQPSATTVIPAHS